MTIAELRRQYPRLVRAVEKQAHSRFKKRPTLVFAPRMKPQNDCERFRHGGKVTRVTKARVFIPKRMARENVALAKLAVMHELRDNLAFQNGNSASRSHRIAQRSEKAFRKKLDLNKSGGWLLRQHYGYGKKRTPYMLWGR